MASTITLTRRIGPRLVGIEVLARDSGLHPEVVSRLVRLGLQYHWHNAGYATFADYLDHLRSKRRNQVKRERRGVREPGM